MPFHRPIPDSSSRSKMSSGVDAIVQAEKGLQMALMVPCSTVVGWLFGAWADKYFHQSWIAIAGIVFGAISGLYYVIRMALLSERNMKDKTGSQNRTGNGASDDRK